MPLPWRWRLLTHTYTRTHTHSVMSHGRCRMKSCRKCSRYTTRNSNKPDGVEQLLGRKKTWSSKIIFRKIEEAQRIIHHQGLPHFDAEVVASVVPVQVQLNGTGQVSFEQQSACAHRHAHGRHRTVWTVEFLRKACASLWQPGSSILLQLKCKVCKFEFCSKANAICSAP